MLNHCRLASSATPWLLYSTFGQSRTTATTPSSRWVCAYSYALRRCIHHVAVACFDNGGSNAPNFDYCHQDMSKNLRNVAIPGTGIPLSLYCSFKAMTYFFILVINPALCLMAAINLQRKHGRCVFMCLPAMETIFFRSDGCWVRPLALFFLALLCHVPCDSRV